MNWCFFSLGCGYVSIIEGQGQPVVLSVYFVCLNGCLIDNHSTSPNSILNIAVLHLENYISKYFSTKFTLLNCYGYQCFIDNQIILINFCYSYTIYDLKSENNFLIYMTLKTCFESNGDCMFNTTIFDGFKLPKKSCHSGTARLNSACKYI